MKYKQLINTLISAMVILMILPAYAGSKNETGKITGTMIFKDSGQPVTKMSLVLWGCSDFDLVSKKYTMTAISVNGKFPYSVGCDEKGVFTFVGLPERGYLIQQQLRGISMGKPIMVKGSPCIEATKGGTTDIGTVSVTMDK